MMCPVQRLSSTVEIGLRQSRDEISEQGKPPPVRVGDRIRLSALENRRTENQSPTGVVVRIPEPSSGGRSVQVMFDGNKLPTQIHRSYVELDDDD
jgi:hypothetical protein